MKSGLLNKRVTFQTNTPTANSLGEYVDTYADTFTVWAEILPLSGRLLFQAQQANSEVTGTIRIRYRSDVEPTMRIVHGSRYFRILSIIDPYEKHDHLDIMVEEKLD